MLRNPFWRKQIRWVLSALLVFTCLSTVLPSNSRAQSAPPPFALPESEDLNKIRSAVIQTSRGDIVFELYPEDAPWHVANFKYLADQGYYKNIQFHLFYEGYIIQAGTRTPNSNPNSGPGYTIPPEFNAHEHEAGTLGMARVADALNPQRRSHGSQFHILLGDAPHMNGSFTVFGKVAHGMDIVRKLRRGDLIRNIIVYVRE